MPTEAPSVWTQELIDAWQNPQPRDAAPEPPRERGVVIGSLLRGIDNLQASLYGAGALIADATDAIDTREWFLDGYLRNTKEAQLNPAEVASFRDIDGPAKAATYAIEGVFENLPTMVPAMVTGGGAAILAAAGRRALAAGVGAYAANWAQESGSIYGDILERTGQKDPGTAATFGAAAAVFDTASDLLMAGPLVKAFERKALAGVLGAGLAAEVQRGIAARMGSGFLKGLGTESITEGIQTAIEEAAVTHTDPSVPFWTRQTVDKIINAAIKGGIAGSAFGTAAGVIPERTDQAAATATALSQANALLERAQTAREAGAPATAAALETEALKLQDVEDIEEVAEPVKEEAKPVTVVPASVNPPLSAEDQAAAQAEIAAAQESEPTGKIQLPPRDPNAVPFTGRISLPPGFKGTVTGKISLPGKPVATKTDDEVAVTTPGEPIPPPTPNEETQTAQEEAEQQVLTETPIESQQAQLDATWDLDSPKTFTLVPFDPADPENEPSSVGLETVRTPYGWAIYNPAKITREAVPAAVAAQQPASRAPVLTETPAVTAPVTAVETPAVTAPVTPPPLSGHKLITAFKKRFNATDPQRRLDVFSEMGYDTDEDTGRIFITDRDNKRSYLTGEQLADAKREFLRLTEPAPAPAPAADPIDAALTRAIEATRPEAGSFEFTRAIPQAAAHAILRIARVLYRAGRTIAEAIREAIKQHRADNPADAFDDAEMTAELTEVLSRDQPAPETAGVTAPPPVAAPTGAPPPSPPPTEVPRPVSPDSDRAVSEAIAWINDPQFIYRKTTNSGRREAADKIIAAFPTLRDALRYFYAPPSMSGITPDLQAVGLMEIANRAADIRFTSNNPVEVQDAKQLQRDATIDAEGAGSMAGQTLQAFNMATTILGRGGAMAQYEKVIREQHNRKVADGLAGDVATAVNTPVPEAQDTLVAAINAKRKSTAVKWSDVFQQARESQKDYARAIFRTLTEGLAGGDRDARVKLANDMSAEYWNTVRLAREKNMAKILERLTKEDPVRKATTAALPELIRLANTGVLDLAGARNAIAEKLGLKPFSEATARRIYEAAQKAQAMPEGAQRATGLRAALNIIPKETGISKWDMVRAGWYGGVLSGIGTQVTNFLGSTANLAHQYAALSARSPQDAPRMFGALLRGLRESATTEFPAIMRGAEPSRLNLDIREAAQTSELLADSDNKWLRLLSNYRYVSRFMQAVDSLWYDASHEVKATFLAAQQARGAGATKAQVDAILNERLKTTPADRQRAETQAADEIRRGLTDARDLSRRTLEITRTLRPADIQEDTAAFALYTTFNNDPQGLFGMLYHSIIKTREKYPVLTPLVPFVRISANVTNVLLNNSPAGLFRLIGLRPDALSLPLVGDRLRYGDRRMSMEEWQQYRARLVLSHAVTLGVAGLAASFFDDDDPPFQVTGSFDTLTPAKIKQLEAQGIKPYQIRIGGVGFDYRITPAALLFAMVGNWADSHRYVKGGDDPLISVEASMAAAHAVIFDQSFLSGLAGLLERPMATSNKGFLGRFGEFMARTAGGFIPSVTKEIDTWVNPTVQQSKGFVENLQKQVPVLRWQIGKPMLNVLGEPVERPRYPWSRVITTANGDPVWEALAEKSAVGVFVPVVSKAARINGKPMDDDQFRRYQEMTGKLYRERLTRDLARFRQMTPDQAKAYFEGFSALREQARARIR